MIRATEYIHSTFENIDSSCLQHKCVC